MNCRSTTGSGNPLSKDCARVLKTALGIVNDNDSYVVHKLKNEIRETSLTCVHFQRTRGQRECPLCTWPSQGHRYFANNERSIVQNIDRDHISGIRRIQCTEIMFASEYLHCDNTNHLNAFEKKWNLYLCFWLAENFTCWW